MKYTVLNYEVLVEQSEDGWFVARVSKLDGCYTQGKTIPGVLERIKEAIELCVESDPFFLNEFYN